MFENDDSQVGGQRSGCLHGSFLNSNLSLFFQDNESDPFVEFGEKIVELPEASLPAASTCDMEAVSNYSYSIHNLEFGVKYEVCCMYV